MTAERSAPRRQPSNRARTARRDRGGPRLDQRQRQRRGRDAGSRRCTAQSRLADIAGAADRRPGGTRGGGGGCGPGRSTAANIDAAPDLTLLPRAQARARPCTPRLPRARGTRRRTGRWTPWPANEARRGSIRHAARIGRDREDRRMRAADLGGPGDGPAGTGNRMAEADSARARRGAGIRTRGGGPAGGAGGAGACGSATPPRHQRRDNGAGDRRRGPPTGQRTAQAAPGRRKHALYRRAGRQLVRAEVGAGSAAGKAAGIVSRVAASANGCGSTSRPCPSRRPKPFGCRRRPRPRSAGSAWLREREEMGPVNLRAEAGSRGRDRKPRSPPS